MLAIYLHMYIFLVFFDSNTLCAIKVTKKLWNKIQGKSCRQGANKGFEVRLGALSQFKRSKRAEIFYRWSRFGSQRFRCGAILLMLLFEQSIWIKLVVGQGGSLHSGFGARMIDTGGAKSQRPPYIRSCLPPLIWTFLILKWPKRQQKQYMYTWTSTSVWGSK